MNNTGSLALASSLIKARGAPGFFGQFLKQPFQQSREYHNPCEPRHLSWHWRPKLSPNVSKCHKSNLKKKACPEYRFFPRFKKTYIPQDITACDPPPPKRQTWSEYLSFLLPEEVTRKPKPATCRKMLEHRRKKCMAQDDYTRCIQGECWPLPTEWYGQGVLHISELTLSKEPLKAVMDAVKPCPPASHMITRCIEKKLPLCPRHEKSCLDSVVRKMPYSQFRAAETDGSPPTVTLKCPIKYSSELLPDHRQDKSFKLSCKNYGEFKTVECPKQMFNRYMSVDLNSKNLVPVPVTVPGYTPQREVKKGVCGRQSLLRPPSSRNFSTGRALMSEDYPEFMRNIDSSHLQPGRSPICFDKLAGRAGMDTELLNKPRSERNSGVTYYKKFTEKELEKHEIEARKDEETPEQRQKRADSSKSKLQLLIEKQERERGNKHGSNLKSVGPTEEASTRQLFTRMVDLEETPYQRSKFHSSAIQLARKKQEERGSKHSKTSKNKITDDQICSGCPGVQAAERKEGKGKSKCSTSKGGARGRCRIQRPLRPGEKVSPLSVRCKGTENSPCMRPRSDPFLLGVANRFVHLSQVPCMPMKERLIIDSKTSFGRDVKSRYSQQSKDLLDQCCDELDKLKKQIEKLKHESKGGENGKDNAKEMLERCCEEMEQLKKQLESLKEDKKNGKSGSKEWKKGSKDLLDQCCEQQDELKKQIEMLKKNQSKGNGSKNKDKGDVAKNLDEGNGSNNDFCEDKGGQGKKGGEKEYKKASSKDDPCKKDMGSSSSDCRKIKEKKEKAEQCVQYLEKQNEKLKKAMEEMKKKIIENKSQNKFSEKCEELEKESKKVEESKKHLIKENATLKNECDALKKELSKIRDSKKPKPDGKKDHSSDPKKKSGGKKKNTSTSVRGKRKPDKKTGMSADDVPEEVKKAMAQCVQQCVKKVKKNHMKKELDKEKKECKQKLKQKEAAMKKSGDGDDDEGTLARFLHGICCKLQDMAKRSKKKKKCCPCPNDDKKRQR